MRNVRITIPDRPGYDWEFGAPELNILLQLPSESFERIHLAIIANKVFSMLAEEPREDWVLNSGPVYKTLKEFAPDYIKLIKHKDDYNQRVKLTKKGKALKANLDALLAKYRPTTTEVLW